MGYRFPQSVYLMNPSIVGPNGPLYKAEQSVTPYPHLWINLWIRETASDTDFQGMVQRFFSIFNMLDKEASCG